MLDGVTRVLQRQGVDAVTTNRIAEAAGVSIGSVYQYFPDKKAIFRALHDRHVEKISHLVESTLVAHAGASLEALIRALTEAVIEAHALEPRLHELLMHDGGHRSHGASTFAVRLQGALRLAIESRHRELKRPRDLDRTLFTVTHMIDALSHAAVQRRPAGLSLAAAKGEAIKAVLAYLRARSSTAGPGGASRFPLC